MTIKALHKIGVLLLLPLVFLLTTSQKKYQQDNFAEFEKHFLQLHWSVAEESELDHLLEQVDVSKLTNDQKAKYYYYYTTTFHHSQEGKKSIELIDKTLLLPNVSEKNKTLLYLAKADVYMRSFWNPTEAYPLILQAEKKINKIKNEFSDYEKLYFDYRKMIVLWGTERLEEANILAEKLLEDLEKDRNPKIIYNNLINGVVLINVSMENPYLTIKTKRLYDRFPKAKTNSFLKAQASLHNNLGQTNIKIGNYEEALKEQQEAKNIFKYIGEKEIFYEWYWHMAWLNGEIGNYEEALPYLKTAKNIIYKDLGETSYDFFLINELDFYIHIINNQPEKAKSALDIMILADKKYNYLHEENLSLKANLGLYQFKTNNFNKSAKIYKELIDKIMAKDFKKYRLMLLEYHYYYLQSLLALGEKELAKQEYQKTIQLIDSKYNGQKNRHIFDLLMLKNQIIGFHNTQEKKQHFESLLKSSKGYYNYEAIFNKELAAINFDLYKKSKNKNLLDKSLQHIKDAYEKSTLHFNKIVSIKDKAKLKENYNQTQELGLKIAYENYQLSGNDAAMRFFLNQPKYEVLRQNLIFKNNESVKNEINTSIELNQILKNRIAYMEQELQQNISDARRKDYKKELIIIKKQLTDSENKIKSLSGKYFDIVYQPENTKIELKDETLISYAYTNDELYIGIFQKDKSQFFKRKLPQLNEKILALNESIQKNNAQFQQISYALYQELFQPIEKFINTEKIIISPSEEMANLNFEYLVSDKQKVTYLLEKYSFNYWLSPEAQQLYKQYQTQEVQNSFLAFSPEKFKDENLTPLSFSTQTIEKIAKSYNGKPIIKNEATETKLKTEIGKAKTVVLATHGVVNEENSAQSYIALQTDAQNDGKFYINEIIEKPISTDFLVLASCEGSKGQLISGYGNFSLSNAFSYAGVKTILFSHWKIDEKATMQILETFFQYLQQGKTKSEALRQAKLDFIKNAKDPKLKNPYYWAGLVIVGDDSPIFINYTWYYISGVILLLLIGGFLWYRKRKRAA